ncbi:MAG: hypothetical protein IJ112_02570 [Oscillospiraceae bacterium]|nr:hypothetical protein [Oscillospiraceae bacterium]
MQTNDSLSGMIVWLICTGGCALVFTVIGIYAYRRKEPMWFWSGSTVRREEISDVKAYNHANGIMWIVFSVPFWASTVLYFWHPELAVTLLVLACTAGLLALIFAYHKIYEKYRKYR